MPQDLDGGFQKEGAVRWSLFGGPLLVETLIPHAEILRRIAVIICDSLQTPATLKVAYRRRQGQFLRRITLDFGILEAGGGFVPRRKSKSSLSEALQLKGTAEKPQQAPKERG